MPADRARLERNPALFVAFRVLFNARFYYPVLAVFFVDLGLTLEQYSLLNVARAVSIVALELPLGALGDQIGRRPLVVFAATVMVVEMAVLAFFPTANATLLFWALLANRVLSGAAEAAASGADEALAYDSVCAVGERGTWPDVLGRLVRFQSGAFVVSMLVGAAVYDPELMGRVAGALGLDASITQETTVRFPVYLTLVLAVGALAVTLRMVEPPITRDDTSGEADTASSRSGRNALATGGLRESVRATRRAARWIASTPHVLAIILLAVALDCLSRVFLTVTSSYFRLAGFAEVWFGPITAGFAALGFLVPTLAKRGVERAAPLANYGAVAALTAGGLAGMALIPHRAGALFMIPLALGLHAVGYFNSHYLNAATASERRATVLSFKSLAGNLAYGVVGWGFALLLRGMAGGAYPEPGSPEEDAVFGRALVWLPVALGALAVPLLAWAARIPAMRRVDDEPARG